MLTGEVAARMHITSGTVTSLLDNLERKGYVVRSSDPDDRRRVLVDITPAAQAVLDEALPAIQQAARRIFDGIGGRRQQALLEILDDIRRAIVELPDDLPAPQPRQRPDRLDALVPTGMVMSAASGRAGPPHRRALARCVQPPSVGRGRRRRIPDMAEFRMGSLDHVHVRVPDRAEAVAWYSRNLGFEPVSEYDFWATGLEGGPLQISADGGKTMLALFGAGDGHPMIAQQTGIAFTVDVDAFALFTRSLPGEINTPSGRPLVANDMIDYDMCWAFDFADPWGNQYELNCYEYSTVRADLVEADGITPVRYWPRDLYDHYSRS